MSGMKWNGRTLTPAQMEALEWLPANGSAKAKPGRLSQAIQSLSLSFQGHVTSFGGPYGPRGGWQWMYHLTQQGQEMRAAYDDWKAK